jgi:hypothetical protein
LKAEEVFSGKPYTEKRIGENILLRTFGESVNNEELVWHRDRKDRIIEVVEGEGWKFQYDNQLPFALRQGDEFSVEAYDYHRLIKGNGPLVLRITENG